MAKTIQGKSTPSAIATMTVQKVMNRYSSATKSIMEDWTVDDLREQGEEGLINALHGYSMSPLELIAREAINLAFKGGRSEGLDDEATTLRTRTGKEPIWRRSSVMENGTCDACAELDGTEIDGPDDDLGEEHEGPNDTCLCLPYTDLTEDGDDEDDEDAV